MFAFAFIPTFPTQISATTTPGALAADQKCQGVIIQADPANTTNVVIGDSVAQTFALTPGTIMALSCTNLNQVYAKMASGTGKINLIVAN